MSTINIAYFMWVDEMGICCFAAVLESWLFIKQKKAGKVQRDIHLCTFPGLFAGCIIAARSLFYFLRIPDYIGI